VVRNVKSENFLVFRNSQNSEIICDSKIKDGTCEGPRADGEEGEEVEGEEEAITLQRVRREERRKERREGGNKYPHETTVVLGIISSESSDN
jgi:hypothetical protein